MYRVILPVLLLCGSLSWAADLLGAYSVDVAQAHEDAQTGEGYMKFKMGDTDVTALSIKNQCVMFFVYGDDMQAVEAAVGELQRGIEFDTSGVFKGRDVYARIWKGGMEGAEDVCACVISSIVVRNMKSRNKDRARLGLSLPEFVCELGPPTHFDSKELVWDMEDMSMRVPLAISKVEFVAWKWLAGKAPQSVEKLESQEVAVVKKWTRQNAYPADREFSLVDGASVIIGTGVPYDVNRKQRSEDWNTLSGVPNAMSIKSRWCVKIDASPYILARLGEGGGASYVLGTRGCVEELARKAVAASADHGADSVDSSGTVDPVAGDGEEPLEDAVEEDTVNDPADLTGMDAVEAYKKRILGF